MIGRIEMKLKLRQVSNLEKEASMELNKVEEIEDLIEKYNEYVIFRKYNNRLEAIIFDGYVAHGRWNTKQQSMEVMDGKRKINHLTDINSRLQNDLDKYRDRFRKNAWEDEKYSYTMKVKQKIKEKKKD